VSDEAGIPLHAGRRYQFGVLGWENDVGPFDFDTLGYLSVDLEESNNWGVGTYTRPSVENADGKPGDFEITFEIRRTPLPDLVPHHVIPRKLDDGRDIACASALNRGEAQSAPFSMVLTVDGTEPPQGRFTMYGLKPAEVGEHCFLTGPLTAGNHELGLAVDVERTVAEMDEYNNRIGETFALRLAPTSSQPGLVGAPQSIAPDSSAASARADLTLKSIRVKGKDATGQNDCDPGRNDVTVAIRNDGDNAATSIAVRLVIDDDDDGSLRTVSSLDPGKETNVEFNRVELKKGQRQLTAAVDPQKLIAESSEDNSELKISVRCKDEGDDDD
jgi:hypothetical protein